MKSRILILALLPLVVALYFMGSLVVTKSAAAREMDRIEILGQLAEHISALVHETQKERGLTAGFYGSGGTKSVSELGEQRKTTDSKRTALEQFVAGFDPTPYGQAFGDALSAALERMHAIDDYRSKVSSMSIPAKEAIGLYTHHNAKMLEAVQGISAVCSNAEMTRVVAAYLNFLQGKERAGIEREVMSKTFAADRFSEGTLRRFGSLVTAQDTYFDVFRSLAPPEQIALLDEKMSDPIVAEVQRMRDIAFKKGEVKTDGFGVDPAQWFASMTKRINLMKEVENELSAGLKARASELKAGARTALITLSGVILVVVMGVLAAVYFIIRSITRPINRVIAGLNEGADQVNAAAAQVSGASQQLAEGASEQASSLEETSAALEQMAAMSRTNSENAGKTNDMAGTAHQAADQGAAIVNQLEGAMQGISDASGKISKIIKVIEEIAFQTNLLALNAAVEAARAGEHGKGFAVVADEVRNLAQRAAGAAKEITDLIANSTQQSHEGVKIATDVAGAFEGIVGNIKSVSDLVKGIAQGSREQAQGVDQVNKAVSQMDKVTQQNAAGAEESASAAEQLSAQPQTVKGMVDIDKVLTGDELVQPQQAPEG